MRIPCVLLLAIAFVAGSAEAASRKWTSANGKFTVQAELVTVKGEQVELRKADGETIEVPLEKLSEADQRYVNAHGAAAEGDKVADAPAAGPEGPVSCALPLKRLDLSRAASGSRGALDFLARLCTPQTFYMEASGRGRGDDADAFQQAVKKEPSRYVAARPFRGVARLGSRRYGFVLDASGPGVPGYDRLYFDLNGNGDLTDDRCIAGSITGARQASTTVFPRVDLPIEVDGSKQDFSFFFSVHCYSSDQFGYVSASLTPAAYREGRILLGGKTRRVVLLDSNSNGRFGDEAGAPSMSGVPHITPGDTLLFESEQSGRPSRRALGGATEATCRVAKVICVDGRFYDCQISSQGDQLTLKPSDVPLGYVTNPNPGFSAVIYSDSGAVMTINGGSSKIALPEGSWRLVSYTMDQFALTRSGPRPLRGKRTAKSDQRPPTSSAAPAIVGVSGRGLILAAAATADSPVVRVRKDDVVPFAFGPPYKATITSSSSGRGRNNTVRLSLLLTGAGGERCTSIMLANGSRPTPPGFTIVNAAGQMVGQGKFEFG